MRRIILIPLLIMTILFSNMAWAMDECLLFADLSGQKVSQIADTPPKEDAKNTACDTLCYSWSQFLFIGYRTPSINISANHFDVVPQFSFYHSLRRKPPTEPPQV
jgi:hypothetical protein